MLSAVALLLPDHAFGPDLPRTAPTRRSSAALARGARKTDSIHHHHQHQQQQQQQHHHHHHPEGVVYRNFCLNSSTFVASEIASMTWWWCIESLFPGATPDTYPDTTSLPAHPTRPPTPRSSARARARGVRVIIIMFYYY